MRMVSCQGKGQPGTGQGCRAEPGGGGRDEELAMPRLGFYSQRWMGRCTRPPGRDQPRLQVVGPGGLGVEPEGQAASPPQGDEGGRSTREQSLPSFSLRRKGEGGRALSVPTLQGRLWAPTRGAAQDWAVPGRRKVPFQAPCSSQFPFVVAESAPRNCIGATQTQRPPEPCSPPRGLPAPPPPTARRPHPQVGRPNGAFETEMDKYLQYLSSKD